MKRKVCPWQAEDPVPNQIDLSADVPEDRLHVTTLGRHGMGKTGKPRSSRDKVRRYRDRLRAQGLRPIQIWVPDVRSPMFQTQAHDQSLSVAQSEQAGADQRFIDAVSDLEDV